MESILTSVKKNLGLVEEMTDFDSDIIMAINTSINALTQMGVGPQNGFQISDNSAMWSDLTDDKKLNMVQTYIFAKVRLMFDPPQLTSVRECLNKVLEELECRIGYEVDMKDRERTTAIKLPNDYGTEIHIDWEVDDDG